jgi:uncharacterized protein (UPF0332 family)
MTKIIYIIIIFLAGFNFLYFEELISRNYISRRVRNIGDSKEEVVLNHFIQRLRNRLGKKILSVYLIPAELRGDKEEIEVIIIFDKMKTKRIRTIIGDITLELLKEHDKLILFGLLPKKEIFEEFGRYFFLTPLWQIFEAGTYLYFGPDAKASFIEVSKEFINSAEEKLKEGDFRNSFPSLYYAVLSLLNASVGEREGYPMERADIFEQFRREFILTDKVPVDWYERLNRIRELNEKLTRNPHTAIDEAELRSLLDFVKELYLYIKDL